MTSSRLGLRVIGPVVAGLLALSGCDSGGDDDTAGGTTNATTTGADTGMDSTGADSSGGSSDLSHEVDIQPIWDAHCTTACHEVGGEWSILDLSPGVAYGAIVDVMSAQVSTMAFIAPGDVDNSYLWHKINKTQIMAGGGGLDMPKARTGEEATVMTQEELDTIEAWIMAGAPM
ncbi:MAG: hypothetical protein KDK70_13730 [Myxococcales bacterium]|nr:hypothetical protein [Myxococcales bacterium]